MKSGFGGVCCFCEYSKLRCCFCFCGVCCECKCPKLVVVYVLGMPEGEFAAFCVGVLLVVDLLAQLLVVGDCDLLLFHGEFEVG